MSRAKPLVLDKIPSEAQLFYILALIHLDVSPLVAGVPTSGGIAWADRNRELLTLLGHSILQRLTTRKTAPTPVGKRMYKRAVQHGSEQELTWHHLRHAVRTFNNNSSDAPDFLIDGAHNYALQLPRYLKNPLSYAYGPIADDAKELCNKAGEMLYKACILVDPNKPKMLGYYRSQKDMDNDLMTFVKAGKAFRAILPRNEFNDDFIRKLTDIHKINYPVTVLQFARTREEIRRAYEEGPKSCMSHMARDYRTDGVHPTEVYATPDLEIPYLIDEEGDIIARGIATNDKRYLEKGYGEFTLLKAALDARGYKIGDENILYGKRILALYNAEDQRIQPYIDPDNLMVTLDAETGPDGVDYRTITSYHNGCTEASHEQGLALVDTDLGEECFHCGERLYEEDDYLTSEYHDGVSCCNIWVEAVVAHPFRVDYVNPDLVVTSQTDDICYLDDQEILDAYGIVYISDFDAFYDEHQCIYIERLNRYVHEDDAVTDVTGQLCHIDECTEINGNYYKDEDED